MKQQLLESFGFGAQDRFPVFADRFPIQLLSYLRLTRIQDPLLFAKVGQADSQEQHVQCTKHWSAPGKAGLAICAMATSTLQYQSVVMHGCAA